MHLLSICVAGLVIFAETGTTFQTRHQQVESSRMEFHPSYALLNSAAQQDIAYSFSCSGPTSSGKDLPPYRD